MKILVLVSALFAALALGACDRKGPAEKAGEAIDEAARDVRDAIKK